MNYYISDLHFFARSQLDNGGCNYDKRPYKTLEEMHEDILNRWNKKITNGDVVYILGDVSMRGRNEKLIELVAKLKGRKVLIKGNHDDVEDYRYKQLFANIYDYRELSDSFEGKTYKLVLSHFPILMWHEQHKGRILLYGHTHQTVEDEFFQECIKRMNERNDIRHENEPEFRAINVGCMCSYMDYEPRSLKELLENKEEVDGWAEITK